MIWDWDYMKINYMSCSAHTCLTLGIYGTVSIWFDSPTSSTEGEK